MLIKKPPNKSTDWLQYCCSVHGRVKNWRVRYRQTDRWFCHSNRRYFYWLSSYILLGSNDKSGNQSEAIAGHAFYQCFFFAWTNNEPFIDRNIFTTCFFPFYFDVIYNNWFVAQIDHGALLVELPSSSWSVAASCRWFNASRLSRVRILT